MIVGIALMLSALVFGAVGLTLAIEAPDSFTSVIGTFHTGFHRTFIVFTAIGFALAIAGAALWLPAVRRCGRAMGRWTAVVGVLLAPVAIVVPIAISAVVLNAVGTDTRFVQAKAAPTTTTLPPATCDASRGGCVVGVVQTTGSSGAFSIEWAEVLALAFGIGIVVFGWSWATRSGGVPSQGVEEVP